MADPHPNERINRLIELVDDLVFILLRDADALDISASALENIRNDLSDLKSRL